MSSGTKSSAISATEIDASGAPSMAFHLYPFMLEYDPYSGDHGLGFFGHAMNVGSYAVAHPTFGWLCFLCALSPAQPATDRPGVPAEGALRPPLVCS